MLMFFSAPALCFADKRMRWTAVCCLACCLALAGGSNDYVDYEVHQWRALVAADPPSLQCCQANSLNLCNNVNDTACSDDGLCYCCPNGGGINATIDGDNTTCTCGYRQTCNDVKCKNKICGDHGYCSGGFCICDYGWSGADCSNSLQCCTSEYNISGEPTLCQNVDNPLVVGQCLNSTGLCYCCPHPPVGSNKMTLNTTTGLCKCSIHVAACTDPGLPPCDFVTCGLHASCVASQGICRCDSGWGNLNPATNSCLTEVCNPPCGVNGYCNDSECVCTNGFSGETCKLFPGGPTASPAARAYKPSTPKSVIILYSALIIPALAAAMVSMATLTNRIWRETQSSTSGRLEVSRTGAVATNAEAASLLVPDYMELPGVSGTK